MKLIVGLGNPGEEYTRTRHNLGFLVVDALAELWQVHLGAQPKLKAEVYTGLVGDETMVLAEPQTFMNLSGESVQKIKQFYKIENSDIWIISDDLDLEFGKVRVRQGGSSGGHNGLKSIIENIGEDFVRIRVGIKNDTLIKIPTEKFVLQRFDKDEETQLPGIIEQTTQVILHSLQNGVEHESRTVN